MKETKEKATSCLCRGAESCPICKPQETKQEKWEERVIEELFMWHDRTGAPLEVRSYLQQIADEVVVPLIQNLLKQERAEIVELGEDLMKGKLLVQVSSAHTLMFDIGEVYDDALLDYQSKIKEKYGE